MNILSTKYRAIFSNLANCFFIGPVFRLLKQGFYFVPFTPDNLRVFTAFVLTYYYRITGVQRVISKAAKHLSPF